MNASRALFAACLSLTPVAGFAEGDNLATAYRTHGPLMERLIAGMPATAALQHSSAVFARPLREKSTGKTPFAYGVVVSADGYLLAKASEVRDLTAVSVTIDHQAYPGLVLISTDPAWDVALLKIDAGDLTPVKYAVESEPEQGLWVVANGATRVSLPRRPQLGVISANSRQVKPKTGMILGAHFRDDDDGFVISQLDSDGDSKKAGLEEGDVVLSIGPDHRPVTGGRSFMAALEGHGVGEKVEIAVKRGDQTLSFNVLLGDLSDSSEPSRNDVMSGENVSSRRLDFPRVIQHDIISDSYAVGGPVFDLDGNCLGMNIARANRSETYAIPAVELKQIAETMIARARGEKKEP